MKWKAKNCSSLVDLNISRPLSKNNSLASDNQCQMKIAVNQKKLIVMVKANYCVCTSNKK